jgi:succinate dehydrogenase / fumarate reductase iron-sulfur subunit/fumarate reductase iron-sulfur subunit
MNEARGARRGVRVEILRSDPGKRTTFEVERFDPMTVLDVLLSVQRQHDPSLGFRYSCRVGMCNVCGVRVDGEPMLACRVPLADGQEELRIEPMEGLPVARDLVVALDQFVDPWAGDGNQLKQ